MSEVVLYEVDGGVARATINRPAQRNALSNEVLAALREAVARARDEDAVRVLVITGAGGRAFCAGGDLRQMDEAEPERDHAHRGQLAQLIMDLWNLGKPTIARVEGYALAGGMGLALACDFVIATDDSQFGVPEARVGLWPYMITLPLVRSMPSKMVLQLMLTGRRVSAAEGAEIGFVYDVAAPGELDAAVERLVGDLVLAGPVATRLGRTSFYAITSADDEARFDVLQRALTTNLATSEAAEGLAAFAQKRRPSWQDIASNAGVES